MKDLTEEKLLEMGFEKVIVPIEESFDDHEYSYFKYDFSKGGGLLTVQCSDEAKDGLYSVELSDIESCLLYTSPSPRDGLLSRMPSSA